MIMYVTNPHRRFFSELKDLQLPIHMESIGENPDQESIERPDGYPCYHWLQSVRGEGEFTFGGARYIVKPGSGVLLAPRDAHSYRPISGIWETTYLTFGGPQSLALLSTFGLSHSAYYEWDRDCELEFFAGSLLGQIRSNRDLSGLDTSADLYRFLTLLKKHGRVNNLPSLSHTVERLAPLMSFMEAHYDDPNIGLEDMAQQVGVSARHLNTLFRQTFGMTAYAYFILLRLRKAKELMTLYPRMTIKEVSGQVGFRDSSHFVATFRRLEGVTPEQFRNLY